MDKEVSEMLEKESISVVQDQEKRFLSKLFLVQKNNEGQHPVINLKQLNKHIPYELFKMEGFHYVKFLLQQRDYICKLDLIQGILKTCSKFFC